MTEEYQTAIANAKLEQELSGPVMTFEMLISTSGYMYKMWELRKETFTENIKMEQKLDLHKLTLKKNVLSVEKVVMSGRIVQKLQQPKCKMEIEMQQHATYVVEIVKNCEVLGKSGEYFTVLQITNTSFLWTRPQRKLQRTAKEMGIDKFQAISKTNQAKQRFSKCT